jgi:hypothetical protein
MRSALLRREGSRAVAGGRPVSVGQHRNLSWNSSVPAPSHRSRIVPERYPKPGWRIRKERERTCGEIRHRLGDLFDLLVNHLTEFASDKIAHENGIKRRESASARTLLAHSREKGSHWQCTACHTKFGGSGETGALALQPPFCILRSELVGQ